MSDDVFRASSLSYNYWRRGLWRVTSVSMASPGSVACRELETGARYGIQRSGPTQNISFAETGEIHFAVSNDENHLQNTPEVGVPVVPQPAVLIALMLGRKLTQGGSFVCLRCRLQLAGAYRRLPFAAVTVSSTRIGQRFIGTYDSPSRADGPKSQKDGSPIADSDNEPSGDAAQQDERSATYWPPPAPPPRPPRPPRPQERTYTSRGQIVAPEQEGLDIDMLGKPGSAIVLREKRTRKKKRQLVELKLDAAAPETQVDPASLLADDNAAAESEDILVNIHELRPKDKRILSDKEFTQLKNTLVDGFTSAQLTRYIREYETIRQLSQEDDHNPELPSWVLEHQPWVPTAVNRVEGVEANLVGYITKGMAPKGRLAVRLMRNCWDLSNQLVLDRDGYLSLRLRDVEFSLLTRTSIN